MDTGDGSCVSKQKNRPLVCISNRRKLTKKIILFITSLHLVTINIKGIFTFTLARRRCEGMDELQEFRFIQDAAVVLFLVKLDAEMTLTGNFSGVKRF